MILLVYFVSEKDFCCIGWQFAKAAFIVSLSVTLYMGSPIVLFYLTWKGNGSTDFDEMWHLDLSS